MVLSGKEIKKRLGTDIHIKPYNEKQVNPNSYNLRLHNELIVYDEDVLDIKKENKTKKIIIPKEGLVIKPGKLYLGRTVEYTETKNLVPMIEGRSSLGRLGIFTHTTAGFGDVGFKGYWTIQLSCVQPIKIYPFVKVCQIFYHPINGDYEEYSSKKYQENDGICKSKIYTEFEN